jgi:hypothetical protein
MTLTQTTRTDRKEALIQHASRWLKAVRTNEDTWRFRAGLRVARTERGYGTNAIARLSDETHISKSALYERSNVSMLALCWRGWAARRVFDDFPTLTYTHFRIALRSFDHVDDQIDALLMAVELAASPEWFAVLIGAWLGHNIPPRVQFDERGKLGDILRRLHRLDPEKIVRVIIK